MNHQLSRRSDLERLKSLSILDVAKWLQIGVLKGNKAHCPFPGHPDQNPSFQFFPGTNSCWCYACGLGGSVIDLVALTRGSSVGSAIRTLRKGYDNNSVRAAVARSVDRQRQPSDKKAFFPDPVIYSALVSECPMRKEGRAYLNSRGLSDATISTFQLGYLADSAATASKLVERFGTTAVYESGLISRPSSRVPLALPSPSIVVPFLDKTRVTYLQSRLLPGYVGMRWMGPIGITKPIYNLSALVGNTNIYICEGAMDVFAAHELKLAAIGLLGSGSRLPKRVVASLKEKTVYVVPDNDRAGEMMERRIRDQLRSVGVQAVSKRLPFGKDVNEYLVISRGKQ